MTIAATGDAKQGTLLPKLLTAAGAAAALLLIFRSIGSRKKGEYQSAKEGDRDDGGGGGGSSSAVPPPLLRPAMAGDLEAMREIVARRVASVASDNPYDAEEEGVAAMTTRRSALARLADLADAEGNAAVHGAAFAGQGGAEALSYLAEECGADLWRKNGMGCSPLWIAAGYGREGALRYLVERAKRLSAAAPAARRSFSEVLLAENGSGDTPLLAAASRGHVGCCRILLESAAEEGGGGAASDMLRRTNGGGDGPLHVAAAGGTAELLELLLPWADGADEEGRREENATCLLDARNSKGLTPLLIACERNHACAVRLLCERGALPLPDGKGSSPLSVAAFCGCEDAASEFLQWDAGRRMLDAKGGRGEDREEGRGGCTPLWLAARTGNVAMVRLLLEAGADTKVGRDEDGMTPLGAAEKYGKREVVNVLVSWEDVRKKGTYGVTST